MNILPSSTLFTDKRCFWPESECMYASADMLITYAVNFALGEGLRRCLLDECVVDNGHEDVDVRVGSDGDVCVDAAQHSTVGLAKTFERIRLRLAPRLLDDLVVDSLPRRK